MNAEKTIPKRRRFWLEVQIDRGLYGFIVRTELDWFPAATWEEAVAIRERERDRFEADCLAIEAEKEAKRRNERNDGASHHHEVPPAE